jgi:hypothetical protein
VPVCANPTNSAQTNPKQPFLAHFKPRKKPKLTPETKKQPRTEFTENEGMEEKSQQRHSSQLKNKKQTEQPENSHQLEKTLLTSECNPKPNPTTKQCLQAYSVWQLKCIGTIILLHLIAKTKTNPATNFWGKANTFHTAHH